ncbi:MAG: hypothetical protein HY537_14880 [Deltaproteobacteria bacterium]|nr:hypothetical protein [Deltaproteobacteria bacterium]
MKNKKIPSLKEIETNFDEWQSISSTRRTKIELRNEVMREAKVKKEAKFTTRLSKTDFDGLKKIAAENAIPYQTLLGHMIHLYVTGQLVNVREIRKVLMRE